MPGELMPSKIMPGVIDDLFVKRSHTTQTVNATLFFLRTCANVISQV